MSLTERTLRAQKKALNGAHNKRFEQGNKEYIIKYEGGISEFVGVYGRRKGSTKAFRYVTGFEGFRAKSTDEIIEQAKEKVMLKSLGF